MSDVEPQTPPAEIDRLRRVESAARVVVAATDGTHFTMTAHDHSRCLPIALDLLRESLSPLGHGTPVPEEATLPSGDARVAAL